MATHEETAQAVQEALKRIGQDARIIFNEFSTETYSQGGYKSGKWTYAVLHQKISLAYWFSAFSSRKEEFETTYASDDDKAKLESDLRDGLSRLRQFVNKKKGTF